MKYLRLSLYSLLLGTTTLLAFLLFKDYIPVNRDLTSTPGIATNLPTKLSTKNEAEDVSKIGTKTSILIAKPQPGKILKLKLGADNTLVFRGTVNKKTVSKLIQEAQDLHGKLPRSEPLYLVLDTPGGSVKDGMHLIDALYGLNRPIHTVTLFAASMGFIIVQNMYTRYITASGTLMSHRAYISGLQGEIPGEAIVKMNYLIQLLSNIDMRVSKRLNMHVADYQRMIADEYWIDGENAVQDGIADIIVSPSCSEKLINETTDQTLTSFFGNIKVKWSKCPLITYPLEVDMSNVLEKLQSPDPEERRKAEEIIEYVDKLINNKDRFVTDYIATDEKFDLVQ